MHFASRLGLDQQSVRGIPATKDDGFARRLVENDRLRARVAELEAALEQARSATVPSASASATVTPSASAKKIENAPTDISAKLKDEPWTEMGISRRTYFRRKAAGVL